MHVEIEAADGLAVVDDDPGFDGRIPGGDVWLLLEADVEEFSGGVENALLYLREGKIGANGLRVEIVAGAAN